MRLIHVAPCISSLFLSIAKLVFHCVDVSFVYSLPVAGHLGFFQFSISMSKIDSHLCACFSVDLSLFLLGQYIQVKLLGDRASASSTL